MLVALNLFFFVFHTALILFNVTGWIWPKTRPWNLATLLVTLFSWTVMGFWHGVGYCICTDWHWQVRRSMGVRDDPGSYLILLVRNLTGWAPPEPLVNAVAGTVFVSCLVLSVVLNVRDRRRLRMRSS